jgi:hypothetical protein
MPEISRFFGIIIRMYFDDHDPAHFHAIYGEAEALIGSSLFRFFGATCQVGRSRWSWNGLPCTRAS